MGANGNQLGIFFFFFLAGVEECSIARRIRQEFESIQKSMQVGVRISKRIWEPGTNAAL